MATAEEDAQHRRMLGSSDAGRHFLNLIDTRLADDPKLARDLVAAGAALGSQAPAGACAAGGKENAAPAPAFDPATALVHLKNLALLNPRGKFDIAFGRDVLCISNPKTNLLVPASLVTHVAILDQIPKDTKKRCLVFIVLDRNGPPVMNGKQRLEAIIVQMLETETLTVTAADGEVLDGPAAAVLCQALGLCGVTAFVAPDPATYTSAKGQLAVSAVVKVSHGHLFPLPGALLFVEKPALFVPHADVLGAEWRRVQSATFDLVLHVAKPGGGGVMAMEFSQIDRSELGRLQSYFAASKIKPYDPSAQPKGGVQAGSGSGAGPSLGAGAGPSGGAAGPAGGYGDDGEEEEDEDEDDEDFDPGMLERGRASKRPRRGESAGGSAGGAGPSGSGAGTAAAEEEGEELGEEEEDKEDDEDEDEDEASDEDEELEDLTDEEDLAADAVRQRVRAGGRKGGQEEEEEDSDDEMADDDD